jgi:hypothetical protein
LEGSGSKQYVRWIPFRQIAQICSDFQPVNIWTLPYMGTAGMLITAPMHYRRGETRGVAQGGVTGPGADSVSFNPAHPAALPVLEAMRVTARSLQLELSEFATRQASDLEDGFAAMAAKSAGAFLDHRRPDAHLQF